MSKLSLPIGKPADSLSATQKQQYINGLSSKITLKAGDFSPFNVQCTYTIDTTDEALKKVYAFWNGYATGEAGNSILISLDLSNFFIIGREKFYKEVPFPTFVRIGGVSFNKSEPSNVTQGEHIGDLIGDEFSIEFFDGSYYFDPRFFMQFFHAEGFLELPAGTINPFAASTTVNNLHIAAKLSEQQNNTPYLKLTGDSREHVILNPKNDLKPKHFTFLSNTDIGMELVNTTSKGDFKITDVSHSMYQTKATSKHMEKKNATSWTFEPAEDLKPHHKSYTSANGKRTVGQALSYKIEVKVNNQTLKTTIKQDIKDIICQEYFFHSKPFQTFDISKIDRKKIEFNSKGSPHFSSRELQKSNYRARDNNWVLNPSEALTVLEFIRWKYRSHIVYERNNNIRQYPRIKSYGLTVNSTWRNPERNEAVKGAKRSNHQYGRALDLKSVHRQSNVANNANNADMQVALFEAGKVFLEALVEENTAAKCKNVEILLERGSKLLWKYKLDDDNNIASQKGSKFDQVVTSTPSADTDTAKIWEAAKYSTHIHIGWKSSAGHNVALKLPELPAENILRDTSVNNIFKNTIIISPEPTESSSSNRSFKQVAASIKEHLKATYPDDETEIYTVSNPLEYLELLGAFYVTERKSRFFFSFTDGWQNGLYLDQDATGQDQTILDELNFYSNIESIDTEDPTFNAFSFGEGFRSNRLATKDFFKLPQHNIDNIRKHFSKSEGTFIFNCKKEYELNAYNLSSLSRVLATITQKDVYGDSKYVSIYETLANPIIWQASDDTPPATDAPNKYYILLQQGYTSNKALLAGGAYQNVGFTSEQTIPETLDLIEIYRQTTAKMSPNMSVTNIEDIATLFHHDYFSY